MFLWERFALHTEEHSVGLISSHVFSGEVVELYGTEGTGEFTLQVTVL